MTGIFGSILGGFATLPPQAYVTALALGVVGGWLFNVSRTEIRAERVSTVKSVMFGASVAALVAILFFVSTR